MRLVRVSMPHLGMRQLGRINIQSMCAGTGGRSGQLLAHWPSWSAGAIASQIRPLDCMQLVAFACPVAKGCKDCRHFVAQLARRILLLERGGGLPHEQGCIASMKDRYGTRRMRHIQGVLWKRGDVVCVAFIKFLSIACRRLLIHPLKLSINAQPAH